MSHKCESCGMAIENGIYCQYCVDESGKLQDFATCFERMVVWQEWRGSARPQAERETITYMATMPAWKDHPEVKARLAKH